MVDDISSFWTLKLPPLLNLIWFNPPYAVAIWSWEPTVSFTNFCSIKLFDHYDSSKIIIVSLIDNLLKGASGQAIQCMNIMFGNDESIGLKSKKWKILYLYYY